jgi:hypothetical protein
MPSFGGPSAPKLCGLPVVRMPDITRTNLSVLTMTKAEAQPVENVHEREVEEGGK